MEHCVGKRNIYLTHESYRERGCRMRASAWQRRRWCTKTKPNLPNADIEIQRNLIFLCSFFVCCQINPQILSLYFCLCLHFHLSLTTLSNVLHFLTEAKPCLRYFKLFAFFSVFFFLNYFLWYFFSLLALDVACIILFFIWAFFSPAK